MTISRNLYMSMLLILMVFVGCETQMNPIATESDSEIMTSLDKKVKDSYPAYAGEAPNESGIFPMWAGKTIDAGTVTISVDDQGLATVTINTSEYSDLKQVHIYVWSDSLEIPERRPAPGQADYVIQNIDAPELTVPLSDHFVGTEKMYLSIHACFVNSDESAYVGGSLTPDGFPSKRSAWWGYVVFSSGEPCLNWCDCHVC